MAKNLRAKIPAEDTLVIFDVNRSSTQRFCQEPDLAAKGALIVANDIKEVVNTSVSPNHYSPIYFLLVLPHSFLSYDEYVPSMIFLSRGLRSGVSVHDLFIIHQSQSSEYIPR